MSIRYLSLSILLFQLIAALLATVHFEKYNDSKESFFKYFLWFTFILEIAAAITGKFLSLKTWWLYNIYMLISFMFFLFWYRSILKNIAQNWAILTFMALFGGVSLWNMVFQSWGIYHKYTFVTGALFTLICAIFHFWQLLNSDEILEVKYKLSFWISTGLLLFNMGMIPFMLLSEYFDFSGNAYYIFIIIGLNLILYGCYSIGFLWTKEKYNRS